jgi:hypothetical protein
MPVDNIYVLAYGSSTFGTSLIPMFEGGPGITLSASDRVPLIASNFTVLGATEGTKRIATVTQDSTTINIEVSDLQVQSYCAGSASLEKGYKGTGIYLTAAFGSNGLSPLVWDNDWSITILYDGEEYTSTITSGIASPLPPAVPYIRSYFGSLVSDPNGNLTVRNKDSLILTQTAASDFSSPTSQNVTPSWYVNKLVKSLLDNTNTAITSVVDETNTNLSTISGDLADLKMMIDYLGRHIFNTASLDELKILVDGEAMVGASATYVNLSHDDYEALLEDAAVTVAAPSVADLSS